MNRLDKTLHIVHCVDTEGPLQEDIEATFSRLRSIFGIDLVPSIANLDLLQKRQMNLNGLEEEVARCFAPDLLKYNRSWVDIRNMLQVILSAEYRNQYLDSFNGGWKYSWHCMDHVGYENNPRHKDLGYGNVFRYYQSILKEYDCRQDEINWHFHPLSLTKNPLHCATSYMNSMDILLQILCRRVLDDGWFPVVNRPGFHAERQDSHLFLEQWIPFDYANQYCDAIELQPDMMHGRFGDWRRSTSSWCGYHPSHDDYQAIGNCRRKIFRCLNVGTRLRTLTREHVSEAFLEAREKGFAILAFANHDYRDMRPDIDIVRKFLKDERIKFPDVKIKFSGAEEAAILSLDSGSKIPPNLSIKLEENRIQVDLISGEIFGPQPFLALKTREGRYYHDNLDIASPQKSWAYVLDDQTINCSNVAEIGIGAAGRYGGRFVAKLSI